MTRRQPRREPPSRSQSALVHKGPGAHAARNAATAAPLHTAPNAALLIDFDNVTMGIRSDLGKELRNLLGSDIIKGKVAVQRAYADWRRYPQYIVPLSESSIDLIFAPAYGSSKKNATDIRLAIDALELVFTRQEIGTFILLSGDSDFSSLVIKLKEYGKYVIGVGIRESSSDLLVQNCDEYYSYNTLAGLVKSSDDEPSRKHDPWELVTEAINRMKQNHDVMRSDRLKQVMQEIDKSFDEKDVGISKFSKFCQEAAAKGLLSVRRMDNGQLEVDVPGTFGDAASSVAAAASATPSAPGAPEEARGSGGRRRRGGRGRGRGGRGRSGPGPAGENGHATGEHPVPVVSRAAPDTIGSSGERLTREEAFTMLRRAVSELVADDSSASAATIRRKVRDLLGRDSESLSERNFGRILQDAHDNDVIDLRKRGDEFEIGRAAASESHGFAEAAPSPASTSPTGMGLRGRGGAGRSRAIPPELLALGVVESPASANHDGHEEEPAKRGRKRKAADDDAPKKPRRSRAKKPTTKSDE